MKKMIISPLIIFFFSFYSCNTTEPTVGNTLALKLEDVSCTEAWITLTTANLQLPAEINFVRTDPDGNTSSQISILTTQDSLLYIDSLLPNTSYKFQASSIENPVSSNEITAATLDTTSHNFTFETWTFGEHSSSVLYDVAIIDENNIWAVGEIYMNDSLGQPDSKRYNAIRWNGANWDIIRIPYNYQGTDFYHPIQSTFAFGSNDIWFCGNGVIHWEGKSFIPIAIPTNVWGPYQMNKIWGSSSNDLYVVGNEGNIAHYQNGQWSRITSGTELHIYDIWGNYNDIADNYEIIAIAANRALNFNKAILRINSLNNIILLSTDGIPYSIHSIWFKNKTYYVVGSGMYKKNDITSSIDWQSLHQGISNYYLESISGNDLNDIIVCGDFGELIHFNGVTWKSYRDNFSGILLGEVLLKNDLVVIVGFDGQKAFITLGQR